MGSSSKTCTACLTILIAIKTVINKKSESNSVTVKQKKINERYERYWWKINIKQRNIRFDLNVTSVTLY